MALTDDAIDKIKAMIVSGEFPSGSKLPKEEDLAQILGLSRKGLWGKLKASAQRRGLGAALAPREGRELDRVRNRAHRDGHDALRRRRVVARQPAGAMTARGGGSRSCNAPGPRAFTRDAGC